VLLQYGYGDSITAGGHHVRTPEVDKVYSVERLVRSVGPRPAALLVHVRLLDNGRAGSIGNGDGIPQPGETLARSTVNVKNEGPGSSKEGFVQLKNRSGARVRAPEGDDFELGTQRRRTGRSVRAGNGRVL
jgi:hypothetical protein